jgi:hypothetical protein
VMECPWRAFNALPATCPSFTRLTELRLFGWDVEEAARAWGLLAEGRLPALTTLSISTRPLEPLLGDGEQPGRLHQVFEAVAGTLRRLILSVGLGSDLPDEACQDLGAAIGKLRRLKHLELVHLFADSRAYHALGRGLAASGGCPELFSVRIRGIRTSADWLSFEPSLIVPSVRDLQLYEDESLLFCCGLVQLGYKYRVSVSSDTDLPTLACMAAMLKRCGIKLAWHRLWNV